MMDLDDSPRGGRNLPAVNGPRVVTNVTDPALSAGWLETKPSLTAVGTTPRQSRIQEPTTSSSAHYRCRANENKR
jgi:hypothetical protein